MSTARHRLDELKARIRPGTPAAAPPPPPRLQPLPQDLASIVGGGSQQSAAGDYWHIDVAAHRVCPQNTLCERALARPICCDTTPDTPLDPHRTVVIDIETCGLAGMPIFLIGLLLPDVRPLTVTQLFARRPAEEPAILAAVARILATRDMWVSFNGKSFDEPFIRERAALHRVPLPATRVHVDVLHAARRAWRETLPNCRLVTLEEHVLRRPRVGDVPSSDVPALYQHYVRTGHARPLRPVLEHNQIDIVSTTELLLRLARPATPPDDTSPQPAYANRE
jgi:uncharacterized protein YprB with RNaseH-like and TPR domain